MKEFSVLDELYIKLVQENKITHYDFDAINEPVPPSPLWVNYFSDEHEELLRKCPKIQDTVTKKYKSRY